MDDRIQIIQQLSVDLAEAYDHGRRLQDVIDRQADRIAWLVSELERAGLAIRPDGM